ncbi:uncharacterized membrane protein-like protein [Tanacetum coccineum]
MDSMKRSSMTLNWIYAIVSKKKAVRHVLHHLCSSALATREDAQFRCDHFGWNLKMRSFLLECHQDHLMNILGSIKEDIIVNVMVIVQRHNNVLMIVPAFESVPTGCQRTRCLLPMSLDGIVLRCEDSSKLYVIPV